MLIMPICRPAVFAPLAASIPAAIAGAGAHGDLTIWVFNISGLGDFEALKSLGLGLRFEAIERRVEEGQLTRMGQESDGLSGIANP
jgi:hypothetical protein